jgi:hypothetical protein
MASEAKSQMSFRVEKIHGRFALSLKRHTQAGEAVKPALLKDWGIGVWQH